VDPPSDAHRNADSFADGHAGRYGDTDCIPVKFGVLTMQPEMSHFQWLLVTLTRGGQ
jgi:hypothetical protein